ncbi:hypothetical protein GCM10008933_17900 [Paenibacillus motobuensis]|uniref:Uncharacterized protein n=1 Tax=Paenibacillus motobuensis TaxID=295324 RepID=A0ABP3I1I6_9BACL
MKRTDKTVIIIKESEYTDLPLGHHSAIYIMENNKVKIKVF